jgi:two-component system, OmpR family, sensor histidine kinase BaeS
VSFRLRIFMLVIVVAVTAIGATAWLTLSLTSRAVERSLKVENGQQEQIVHAVQQYGLRHGHWPGVDQVVDGLARRTGLHIQLRTANGDVLVDSDTIRQRPAGPVQGVPLSVDARPALEPPSTSAEEPGDPKLAAGFVVFPRGELFGPGSLKRIGNSPASQAVRQVGQYRAALLVAGCIGKKTRTDPALAIDHAPYLTPQQQQAHPDCVQRAEAEVYADEAWQKDIQRGFSVCLVRAAKGLPQDDDVNGPCFQSAFKAAASTVSAVPLQILLGGRAEADLGELRRPAAFGVAGLVAVAVIGTALIARRVSRPVRRLTAASRELADGNLDVRVPARGGGELARLSESFNAMAEAVQRSEERQRRLVADVAHEMRTPLSNLRGYLEGLSDGVVAPSRDLFASLHEETLLQRRILDDLQVLALAEAGNLGYVKAATDLAELAATTATAHRVTAVEAGVALTVDTPAPVGVDGDQDRLRQVLGNLLTNAIRYTDRDGHVLVRVRAEAGEAVVTVQDTGVGIAPGDVSRVFDRFWRADPARQRATGGTGLGLTIAHRIVTDHGGRIEVTSRAHVGTTFTVRLPLIRLAVT